MESTQQQPRPQAESDAVDPTGYGRETVAGVGSRPDQITATAPADEPGAARHHHHRESHMVSAQTVRDVVIGMADGLTVPFALAAGLSGATTNTRVIVTAGLAEIAAGSIAMGLGGYLAARGDREHYLSERAREFHETEAVPEIEKAEILEIFDEYGIDRQASTPVVEQLSLNKEKWVDFMMKFELGLEEPDQQTAWKSATTIAISYIVGGALPLSPYFFFADAIRALEVSCVFTAFALFLFGFFKGMATGVSRIKSAIQTTLIGGLAASAAFGLAKLVSEH